MIAAPRTVVIFRALQLGDMLCAVPALRAIRAAWPGTRVTLVGLPWAHAFVERYACLIDDLEVFPGAPGFPEQDERGIGLEAFLERLRSRRFDLAIQLHGSGGPANDIVCAMGAGQCAGFLQPGERRKGVFIAWPDSRREPVRYLALMRALGMRADDERLWLPISASEHADCERLLAEHGIGRAPFVIVHPGAQLPSRRWPASRFAAVADRLDARGLRVVITGTTGESALVQAMVGSMAGPASDLTGRTGLGTLAALIARAALVVCNDTGISHIAAAVRTPSVVIACGSDTARWAPAERTLNRVLAHYPPCRPCSHRVCPTAHECAAAVPVERVIAAAQLQLRRWGGLAR